MLQKLIFCFISLTLTFNAKLAKSKEYKPLTVDALGIWGADKLTLLNLIQQKMKTNGSDNKKIICITLNVWAFDGYEDANGFCCRLAF